MRGENGEELRIRRANSIDQRDDHKDQRVAVSPAHYRRHFTRVSLTARDVFTFALSTASSVVIYAHEKER